MMPLTLLLLTAALLPAADNAYEFTMNSIDGDSAPLAAYKGKTVMFVNVASQCEYTPQYKGLEALYRRYKDRGFVIVGVPANNFGGQEPGTNAEIKTFCKRTYDVTFPLLSKVSVKGANITPLYSYLTSQSGGEIQWNFTKFLVDKQGKVIGRFEPNVDPESRELVTAIERALR